MPTNSLRRVGNLSLRDWLTVGQAAAALTIASAAIAWLPFGRLSTLMASARPHLGPVRGDEAEAVNRVRWAVEAAGRRLPWRIVCFQKGLALHWMLRRRGVPSQLHYGVSQREGLKAHVWVTLRDEAIIGGNSAGDYVCLARYPAPSGR